MENISGNKAGQPDWLDRAVRLFSGIYCSTDELFARLTVIM